MKLDYFSLYSICRFLKNLFMTNIIKRNQLTRKAFETLCSYTLNHFAYAIGCRNI
jgi:hypothetical protein